MAFLRREYKVLAIFVLIVAILLAWQNSGDENTSPLIALSFVVGALCSGLAGFFGMRVATAANVRTSNAARTSLNKALSIAFGGGGTDVSPYCDERGGRVLNATIDRYAYVTLVPNDKGKVRLHSLDFDAQVEYHSDDAVPAADGNMDLAKGVIRRLKVDEQRGGFDLYTHTDCPPGSGLGASSTMMVSAVIST